MFFFDGSSPKSLLIALLFLVPIGMSIFALRADDVDVTGIWDLTVETQQGTATPTVNLKQDGERITGTYAGKMGKTSLEGSIRGNNIEFSVTIRFQDMPFAIAYSGIVEGDTMRGTARFGDAGSARWTAKRRN